MRVQEIMTREPACCTADDTARHAAELMEKHDCGGIPVVEDEASRRVVGIVTDRDIALRAVARGRGADTSVRDLMSRDPECCQGDADVDAAERIMKERQVRRVPVVDGEGSLVGIVAQADLALEDRAADDREVGEVVERISQPGRPRNQPQAD